MSRLAFVSFGCAVLCALAFHWSEDEPGRRLAAGSFGSFLGAALCLFGLEEKREGRIRGRRTRVERREHPVLFHVLLAGTRWLPGVAMLVAGVWHAWLRAA